MPDNVFAGLDEIIARQKQAEEQSRQEYEEILNEKIFVIDDGDHSTMLFAKEY